MRFGLKLWLSAAVVCFGLGSAPGSAQGPVPGVETAGRAPRYVEKEIFVPVSNARPQGLDVVTIYAETAGRHPLVVLTHGTSIKPEERMRVTPWGQYNQALWFARRGFLVLVVVRKGYGRSAGTQDSAEGGCGSRGSFSEAGDASAEDLRQVMEWAAKQPEVDASSMVSVGVSTGGLAQVALSADPPKGLRAAISFAGGRGSDGKEHNCNLDGLLAAFHGYGKRAAKHGPNGQPVPMLWVYAQNDHYFPPAMAVQFEEQYRKGGGLDQFVMAPPDGEDGHHLYSHPDAWSETVTAFLRAHDLLPLGDEVLPPPAVPMVPAPGGLHERGMEGWKRYLAGAPYKAFAMTGDGWFAFATGSFDQEIADKDAVERCRKAAGGSGGSCRVVARTK